MANWVRAFWTGPSPACHSMRVRSNYDDPDPGVVASTSAHDPGVTKGRGSETAVTPVLKIGQLQMLLKKIQ